MRLYTWKHQRGFDLNWGSSELQMMDGVAGESIGQAGERAGELGTHSHNYGTRGGRLTTN
jgi:hypothetical protein